MIVRRYTGPDLDTINQAIVHEMGDRAVVVHTTSSKPRRLLGLGRPVYEVTAVAEDPLQAEARSPATPPENDPEGGSILLEQQRVHYRGLRHAIQRLDERLDEAEEKMRRFYMSTNGSAQSCLCNIHAAWIPELAREVSRNSDGAEPASMEDWRSALARRLTCVPGLPLARRERGALPAAYAFVGPTGVGKTTTLAKVAAQCVLRHNLNVGLITLDTYRMGAVEQLKEYAKLLGTQLSVAGSGAELARQIAAFADKDVVLVDTPGRSQFDVDGIGEIRAAAGSLEELQVLLQVTAGQRAAVAETIVDRFSGLRLSALVLTKTDEAVCCDGLTRLLDKAGSVPVAYVTNGQRVPEDILDADPDFLAALIIPELPRRSA